MRDDNVWGTKQTILKNIYNEFQQKTSVALNADKGIRTTALNNALYLAYDTIENGQIVIKEGETTGHHALKDGTDVFIVSDMGDGNVLVKRHYKIYY